MVFGEGPTMKKNDQMQNFYSIMLALQDYNKVQVAFKHGLCIADIPAELQAAADRHATGVFH